MTKIASDAMVIQLAVDMAGDGEVQERLARLNEFIGTINAKAKAAQDSIDLERMSVEGKYNPDIQRDYEIEKAIQLTNKLNLSLEAQDAILEEILEKHRKMSGNPNQYAIGNTPNEAMVRERAAAALAAAEEQARAEEKLLLAKKQAARETERLIDAELSHAKRASNEMARIRELRADGIIDQEGFLLRARAAKKQYDDAVENDAKIAKAKKDAADKLLAQEQADIAKRTAAFHKEYRDRVDAINAQKQAFADAAIEATQRRARASIEATELADKQANAERQKAINLLHSLEDATQRYTRVSDELRAHLDAGDITNEQYAQGLANIERRQRSMAGGANNVAYAIGNTVTGLEDFVTVLSITGFGMEGFSAATRAASNNVGQAVRSLGTAASAISAPLVSIGMVLAGAAIPYLYKYVTGAEDAEAATRKFEERLKSLNRTSERLNIEKLFNLEQQSITRDIGEMTESDSVSSAIQKIKDDIVKSQVELENLQSELENKTSTTMGKSFNDAYIHDFDLIVDAIGAEYGKLGKDFDVVEESLRLGLENALANFFDNVSLLGGEDARKQLERDIREIQGEIQGAVDALPSGARVRVLDTANGYMNSFYNTMGMFNDAAVIDAIQAAQAEMEQLGKEDGLAILQKRKELEALIDNLNQLRQQENKIRQETDDREFNEAQDNMEKARLARMEEELAARDAAEAAAEAQAQAQHLDQQAMETELEKLKIQQQRNSLLGDENDAERQLFDLALRRKELMESGIAAPDVLEGLFNSELEAMAAELEKQIAKAEEVSYAVAAMSEPQAYTSANKQIVDSMGERDTKLQEQIDLLKAIRDHLTGAATLQVEIM